jgi:hypothetical protein
LGLFVDGCSTAIPRRRRWKTAETAAVNTLANASRNSRTPGGREAYGLRVSLAPLSDVGGAGAGVLIRRRIEARKLMAGKCSTDSFPYSCHQCSCLTPGCWCWFIEGERPVLQKVNDKKMDDRKTPLDGLLIFMSSIFLSTLPGCDPDVGDAGVGVLI